MANGFFSDSFNINSFLEILSDVQRTAGRPKQINNLFIVDFNKRALNNIIDSDFTNLFFDALK